jgi:predicted ArsR family transcriptional regulator
MSNATTTDDGGPFEEQRQIYDLLSQETRHLILQFVLGHPAHLPSLDELDYMMPKNKAAIRDQLQTLTDAEIIERYEYPPNEDSRNLPSQFYGLTKHGVEVLSKYNYLSGLPIARAVYDNTRLSEKAQRHRDAPRPELPAAVSQILSIDDEESAANDQVAQSIREQKGNTHSVDDQISLVRAFYEAGIGPGHDGIKRAELLDRLDVNLDYQPRTVLKHLVDIGLLEETVPPGPGVFAISERIDEIVNGRVTAEAEENIEALIAHIDDELQSVTLEDKAAELEGPQSRVSSPSVALADGAGRTIRSILAEEFGINSEQVIGHLRSSDPVDRLNAAVEAVESTEEVSKSENYGRILFVNQPYRYHLSERAMRLLE